MIPIGPDFCDDWIWEVTIAHRKNGLFIKEDDP